jgi:hypothetical protein
MLKAFDISIQITALIYLIVTVNYTNNQKITFLSLLLPSRCFGTLLSKCNLKIQVNCEKITESITVFKFKERNKDNVKIIRLFYILYISKMRAFKSLVVLRMRGEHIFMALIIRQQTLKCQLQVNSCSEKLYLLYI